MSKPPAPKEQADIVRRRTLGRRSQMFGLVILFLSAIVWSALPASGAAAITVSPNTGIASGATVKVDYTGFPSEITVTALQCKPNFQTLEDCDTFSLLNSVTSATGSGTIQLPVYVLPNDIVPGEVECDGDTPCVVAVVQDINDLSLAKASATISFASTVSTIPVTTTTSTPSVTTTVATGATTTTLVSGATTTTVTPGATTTTAVFGATTTTRAFGATTTTLASGATTTTSGATTTTAIGATTSTTTTSGVTSTTRTGGSSVGGSGSGDDSLGALALTGVSFVAPVLGVMGVLMIVGGSVVRTRARLWSKPRWWK